MKLSQFTLKLKGQEFAPLIIGGMGVDISTSELALQAARNGAIGHISDAMSQFLSDKKHGTNYTIQKLKTNKASLKSFDKTNVKFDLEHLRDSQIRHVENTVNKKTGSGLVFINVMEKLTMASPTDTLKVRLCAALDGGIDGVTLSAGLHTGSLGHIKDHPRFRDVLIGIIVSSDRALKIFLKSAQRYQRLPDYIVVEGPLAGGHLGFSDDWEQHSLPTIVQSVVKLLKDSDLDIPVVAAGGVFTGSDAVEMIKIGASAVQVATRFTITKESGLPSSVKQKYFEASESDVVVNYYSPTGYLMRMLKNSPSLNSNIKPNCEALGYMLSREGKCSYIDAYEATAVNSKGVKEIVKDKMCLCFHFSKHNCYTCGHYVYRLKDTTIKNSDGTYQLLNAEHVLNDYLYSEDHKILLPKQEEIVSPALAVGSL